MDIATARLEHGERYGKLTVLRRINNGGGGQRYLCGCECGNTVHARPSQLMKGKVKSCRMCVKRTGS